MYHKTELIKWLGRLVLVGINRFLMCVVDVKRLKILNTKFYLKKHIDLHNPSKLNERLLCAYYNSDMEMLANLTDKYQVREYVKKMGLEEILVPVYGIYSEFKEIDFKKLPDKFVLKATHGCDMTYICLDKTKLELKKLRRKIWFWTHLKWGYLSLEIHYNKIQPRILCEKCLETEEEIIDYKFHCSNGKVLFLLICTERSNGPYLDVFMPNWEPRPEVIIKAKNNPKGITKPRKLKEMIAIAEKLSKSIPFVRVDLYEVDGKIYFGELTFTPATGVLTNFSDEFLREQGKYWNWS